MPTTDVRSGAWLCKNAATNPEQRAEMQVLSTLLDPAYFTDFHLFCLLVCRMVNVDLGVGLPERSVIKRDRIKRDRAEISKQEN